MSLTAHLALHITPYITLACATERVTRRRSPHYVKVSRLESVCVVKLKDVYAQVWLAPAIDV